MKLVIQHCKTCRNKISLNVQANNRFALRNKFGDFINVRCSNCHTQNTYQLREIYAETDSNSTLGAGVVGGLVGLLGGPLGLLIGGAIGGAIGNESDATDKKRVNQFNSSH